MNQEQINSLWAKPPVPQKPLPKCPSCGEPYLGNGKDLCVECEAELSMPFDSPEVQSAAKTMAKFAAISEIMNAAQVLEHYNLLAAGETATSTVKRYVQANLDINEQLKGLKP